MAAGRPLCKGMPIHLTIGNTHRCNFDCFMCFRRHIDLKAITQWDLGIKTFRQIAMECFPYTLRVELSVSGEPLASPTIIEELNLSAEYGIRLNMTTNGSYLIRDQIRQALLNTAGDISVSFDGATKDTFERIRRRGNFNAVVNGVRTFNEERKKLPASNRPNVGATTVLMHSTINELPSWVSLMHKIGMDSLEGSHILVPADRDQESLVHYKILYNKMREESLAEARARSIPLILPPPFPLEDQTPGEKSTEEGTPAPLPSKDSSILCPYVWHRSWIQYDGSVSPCCNPNFRSSMGNVNENGFKAVWNGPAYQKLRRSLRSGTADPACRTCHLVLRQDREAVPDDLFIIN